MELQCTHPLHTGSLLGFLALRAVEGVEEVEGTTYRRSLQLAHGPAVVAVDLADGCPTARLEAGDPRDEAEAAARLRDLLDLDADPLAVDAALGDDPLLRELVAAAPGRRVPGCVD